jgi:YD repeat-containing protein
MDARGWWKASRIAHSRPIVACARRTLALVALLLLGWAVPAAAVSYVYDELGRLVGVVDPAGDTAVYTYDAVGNLLSITRYASSTVSLIGFTPSKGPIGTTVTIYGTGFSTTPSSNTVTFNGTGATVTSASATQLVATVPAGATTGAIGVTAPGGSATSSASFTVTSSSGAPTMSSFTPTVGAPGTAVTVTGTNFETIPGNDRLSFNIGRAVVGTATSTSLGVTVPGTGTSGHLTLSTPGGIVQSTDDFFVPPSPYTAADVASTGRLSIGGSSLTVNIPTANKIGLAVFDGTANQQVSLGIGQGILNSTVSINSPDGTQVGLAGVSYLGAGLHIAALPVTGTYTILVDPSGSNTGSVALTLSQDLQAGTITTTGSAVSVNITRAGQRARLSFSGTAGQRLSLGVASPTVQATYTISKPDGSTLISSVIGGQDASLDMPQLPVTGTYGILIEPATARTMTMTLTLSEEVSATISIDGASVPVTVSRAGQRARLTFDGTAGQRLTLGLAGSTITMTYVSVLKPDGSTLFSPTLVWNGSSSLSIPSLPTTGSYTLLLDPGFVYTGQATLTLSQELTGSITPGGSPVTVSITRAGQQTRLTFSGTAGQRVSLNVTGVTVTQALVAILKPDESTLAWITVYAGNTGFIDVTTLATTGAYEVFVDPAQVYTGNLTLTLYDVPPDVTGSLTINGSSVSISLTVPGQKAQYTFSGTSGQQVTVHGANSTMGCVNVFLSQPNGSTSSTSPCTVSWTLSMTLAVTGTDTVKVDPQGANTGSVNLSVTSP